MQHFFHANLIGELLSWIRAGRVEQMNQGTSLVENTSECGQLEDRPSWRGNMKIDPGVMWMGTELSGGV
jgi:hypothetical protein